MNTDISHWIPSFSSSLKFSWFKYALQFQSVYSYKYKVAEKRMTLIPELGVVNKNSDQHTILYYRRHRFKMLCMYMDNHGEGNYLINSKTILALCILDSLVFVVKFLETRAESYESYASHVSSNQAANYKFCNNWFLYNWIINVVILNG